MTENMFLVFFMAVLFVVCALGAVVVVWACNIVVDIFADWNARR